MIKLSWTQIRSKIQKKRQIQKNTLMNDGSKLRVLYKKILIWNTRILLLLTQNKT